MRRYDDRQDEHKVKEVIRNFVLSRFSTAFWFCLFREITLQLIVLATAVFFIFFGIPLVYCVSSVPIVIIGIAVCVYCSHYNKAIEISNVHTPIGFVVDVYEPFIMRLTKKEIEYCDMTQEEINEYQDLKKMRRKIVGTVSVKNHHSLHESAWIFRLAVDPEYPFERVAKLLIKAALRHAYDQRMYSCETVSMECHEDLRELLLRMGFMIKQIYHKNIVGSSLRVMKAQMGIDLEKYFRNQKRNLNVQ